MSRDSTGCYLTFSLGILLILSGCCFAQQDPTVEMDEFTSTKACPEHQVDYVETEVRLGMTGVNKSVWARSVSINRIPPEEIVRTKYDPCDNTTTNLDMHCVSKTGEDYVFHYRAKAEKKYSEGTFRGMMITASTIDIIESTPNRIYPLVKGAAVQTLTVGGETQTWQTGYELEFKISDSTQDLSIYFNVTGIDGTTTHSLSILDANGQELVNSGATDLELQHTLPGTTAQFQVKYQADSCEHVTVVTLKGPTTTTLSTTPTTTTTTTTTSPTTVTVTTTTATKLQSTPIGETSSESGSGSERPYNTDRTNSWTKLPPTTTIPISTSPMDKTNDTTNGNNTNSETTADQDDDDTGCDWRCILGVVVAVLVVIIIVIIIVVKIRQSGKPGGKIIEVKCSSRCSLETVERTVRSQQQDHMKSNTVVQFCDGKGTELNKSTLVKDLLPGKDKAHLGEYVTVQMKWKAADNLVTFTIIEILNSSDQDMEMQAQNGEKARESLDDKRDLRPLPDIGGDKIRKLKKKDKKKSSSKSALVSNDGLDYTDASNPKQQQQVGGTRNNGAGDCTDTGRHSPGRPFNDTRIHPDTNTSNSNNNSRTELNSLGGSGGRNNGGGAGGGGISTSGTAILPISTNFPTTKATGSASSMSNNTPRKLPPLKTTAHAPQSHMFDSNGGRSLPTPNTNNNPR